eukprot:6051645-Amphidinium_carterae.1
MLNQTFKGANNSVIVEDLFKHIQDSSRDVNNGACSRHHRMMQGVMDDVLGQYGLQDLPEASEPLNQSICRVLPKAHFEAGPHVPDLSAEDREALLSGVGWPSPSAAALKLLPAAWSLVKFVHKARDLRYVSESWHSLLLMDAGIVENTDTH